MARIAGVDLQNKRMEIALTYLRIGRSRETDFSQGRRERKHQNRRTGRYGDQRDRNVIDHEQRLRAISGEVSMSTASDGPHPIGPAALRRLPVRGRGPTNGRTRKGPAEASRARRNSKPEETWQRRSERRERKGKEEHCEGVAHIQSTFNNTIVTITDLSGNVIAWASRGCRVQKSRKSTPLRRRCGGG